MNRIYSLGVLALSSVLITACQPYDQQDQHPHHNHGTQYGYRGDQDTTDQNDHSRVSPEQQAAAQAAADSVPPAPKPTPPPGVTQPNNHANQAAANAPKQLLYGKPVPGKPGFLTSPYNPNAGLIDARGLPPGSEIRDSFTPGKTILVP